MHAMDIRGPQAAIDEIRDRLPGFSDIEKLRLDQVARRSAEVLERATGRRRSRPWGWIVVGGAVLVAAASAIAISMMDRTSARWPAPLRRRPSPDVQERIERAVASPATAEGGAMTPVEVTSVEAAYAVTTNGLEPQS